MLCTKAEWNQTSNFIRLSFEGGKEFCVPLDFFTPDYRTSPEVVPMPDPRLLKILDAGLTIGLGLYEVGTDTILWAFDPEWKEKNT